MAAYIAVARAVSMRRFEPRSLPAAARLALTETEFLWQVRLYLDGKKLTPSYDNVNNMFSVRYFLNLVLVDQSGRRYFKAQEITLWRKDFG
mmetsp:Transcript_404/g.1270  ORF Transcript_404/g.1270 Transcript_404/m.1270 type:complete len:91 (-) Transcript_404:2098-2370(-)